MAKSAWGKLVEKKTQTGNEEHTETSWILVHDQLTFTKPESPSLLANIPEGENPETNIITYNEYIEDHLHPVEEGSKPDAVIE